MGAIAALRCPKCGQESLSRTEFRCTNCNCVLEVNVDIGHLNLADFDAMRKSRDRSIWRWFEFFPVRHRSSIVTLGEGDTPLIHARHLGELLDIPRLYLKNDTLLPTGSLKDRSNSVGISVAAYAGAAGMKSVVLVPAGTAPSKIIQARACGATVIVLQGSFDGEVALLYRDAIEEFGWYDCLSSNPYRVGKKSYAYEIVDQLDGQVPDWVIHPTAGGAGIHFMWQGFGEFVSLGWTDRLPKLVAAQSAMAAPIALAFDKGLAETEPVTARRTVAESIQVGNPAALGWRALAAVRASKGMGMALNDEEILEAQSLQARLAGIFAEPAASVSLAGAQKLRAAGVIDREDLVVCNVTGHGLKQPEAMRIPEEELRPISPNLGALREELRKNER